jgi:hypothetical protein
MTSDEPVIGSGEPVRRVVPSTRLEWTGDAVVLSPPVRRARSTASRAATQERYPMLYEVRAPHAMDRTSTALRLFYMIPLLLIWLPLQLLIGGALVAGWCAVAATRTYPRWLYAGLAGAIGFGARIEAYALLFTDRYPGFGEGKGPVRLGWAEPPDRRLSRWRVCFWKTALLIPHFVALIGLTFAQAVVTVVAWFAILQSRRYPPDLLAFSAGINRWRYRVVGYYASFNDRYPPFNPWAEAGPANPLTVLACGACGLAVAGLIAGLLFAPEASNGNDSLTLSYEDLRAGNSDTAGWAFASGPSDSPNFVVTLLGVEDPDTETADALHVGAGDRAVNFELEYENLSTTERVVEAGSASLKIEGGSDGNSAQPVLITAGGQAVPASVNPGELATVRFTFVIPADATVQELEIAPPWESGSVTFRFE